MSQPAKQPTTTPTTTAKPTPTQPSSLTKFLNVIQPFAIGCISGMVATSVVQPIDMVKVRIQIKSEEISNLKAAGKSVEGMSTSPFAVISEFKKQNGIKGFYKGLDAGLTRQVFYTTTRLGVYKTMFDKIKAMRGRNPDLTEKSFCGLAAGFIGAIIGNPPDLALIRIQNDTSLPVAERRNYTGVGNAFSRIMKEEGVAALWKGCTPTVARAMAINLVMLASFDEIKERLNKKFGTKDSDQARVIASATSGILSAVASLPFDNAKTKIQKQKKNAQGVLPYKNIFDCMLKTVKNEGVTGLWVGLPTFCVRISPHVVITLLVQDFVTNYVNTIRKEKKF